MDISEGSFIWNSLKEASNIKKHGLDFRVAAKAFADPNRKIYIDEKHSSSEERYFCIANVEERVLTVRFTYREKKIRILGAGYWRKGKRYYEQEN